MALTLTSTFDQTKTVASKRQRADFTPSGGSVVKISCRSTDVDSKLTTQPFKYPSATDDTNRDIAEVELDGEETITLIDVGEMDTVCTTLGGLNGLKLGTAIVYISDPRDATGAAGKVRATISGPEGAPFACSLRRADGAVKFGGQDVAKTSLILRNLSGSKLVWTPNVAAPDTVE